ncbi:WD repeat-containing protein jip5-like protein [Acrodontium crateriforme]|uniref:WD repeat-containing protein JIP5 n=1 Tax=Acrodontium crateriforme TaxID=150365 RepID=A0AAQ3R5N2_9PEZI|nr:WD repeat-containing protein jip5-like protein [Acrodontium crateriforme]
MFENLCALPLGGDLFAQAVHPLESIVAVGLSSGHVATLKLPAVDSHRPAEKARGRRNSNGTDMVETVWRTKRHKGSCRCLAYSLDGTQLYSAGTDGIVKAANSETGQVTGKVAIPMDPSLTRDMDVDSPTVIHALTPQTLLLATDSGALHLYDMRDPAPSVPSTDSSKTAFVNLKPAQTHRPHADYVSSLSPIPASASSTSGFSKQWLTTGGTTLALTDLRRGVLVKSEDQEQILLSSLYVTGLPARKNSTSSGEKALVGNGDGVITLWEKGQWDDQDERITVSREKETLDCLAQIPDGIGSMGKKVAVGLGDGKIRFVRLGMNKVVGEVQHDEVEGVTDLAFDVTGRMISGGGSIVKVWQELSENDGDVDDSDEDEAVAKRPASDSDNDTDEAADESSEEEQIRKRHKKKKRSKGSASQTNGATFAGLD